MNINLDAGYFTHLKTKRLVKLLGVGAEVLPIKLWCYTAAHYAETGILSGHSAEDVEAAVDWQGAPGAMAKAMTDIRFLDVLSDGSYQVHDWLEHSGHLAAFAQRARKAANARWGNPSPMLKDAQASPSIASDDSGTPKSSASNAPTNQLTNQLTNKPTTSAPPEAADGENPQRKGPADKLPEIPSALRTPEFEKAWDDWVEHRRQRKPKVTPLSAKESFSKLGKWGVDRSIAAIRHSIASSYQGIFEPTTTNYRNSNGTSHSNSLHMSSRGSRELPEITLPAGAAS